MSWPSNCTLPRLRPDDPEDGLQGRGLPRGVPAEQAYKLALPHVKVDVLEDVDLAVERVDPAQLQERLGRLERDGAAHADASARRPRYASTTRGSVATGVERALGDLHAVVESDDPVRDPLDDVHVVLDDEDRVAALLPQPADQRRSSPESRPDSSRPPARRAEVVSASLPSRVRSRGDAGSRTRGSTRAGPTGSRRGAGRRRRASPPRAARSHAPHDAPAGVVASTRGPSSSCARRPPPSRSP